MQEIEDVNVAATLHDIAANCDATTGKILRQCQKAANEGKTSIVVKAAEEDYYASKIGNKTVLIEKLEQLGFKVEAADIRNWWNEVIYILDGYPEYTHRHLKISW